MALCSLLVSDFMHGTGRYDDRGAELYDLEDVRIGELYADNFVTEGFTREPFHDFDLKEFSAWCRAKLI